MDKHTCRYELYYNPSAAPTGSKYMHARLEGNGKEDMEDLLEELSKRMKRDIPPLRAVVDTFMEIVADELAKGKFVQIDRLGGFRMTLSCPPKIKRPEDVRGGSISVKGLEYRPDKELVKDLRASATFRRTTVKKNVNDDMDTIIDCIRNYFADPNNVGKAISTKIVASRMDLTPKRASERMHELVARGYLVNPSPDPHHPLYLAGEKIQEEA